MEVSAVGAGGVCWLVLAPSQESGKAIKPNELMQAVGSLIEEISGPYERNTGEQAKLTREQWNLFVQRIEIMRVMNMPRLGEEK